MPELPEVETIRRQMSARLKERTIASVEILKTGRELPRGKKFIETLVGRKIVDIERRAKLLIWRFAKGDALTAHLKMTGRLVFVDAGYKLAKHDRIIFAFKGLRQKLVWSDVRQFGYLKYVAADELARILSAYGPEPLEMSPEEMAERMAEKRGRAIKTALLDQVKLAGVGSIYADEACHRAGIRPMRRTRTLTREEWLRLAQEIQNVLRESIAAKGTSSDDYVDTRGEKGDFVRFLRVYGRKGQPCLKCGNPIKRAVVAQRGSHYCSKCQK